MTDEDMFFQQAGTVAQTLLSSNTTMPLMHLRHFHDVLPHLCIRLSNMHSEWSNPFQMTDIGSTYVKLGRLNENVEDLIRVEIALEKATLFISFYKQESRWPISVENLSQVDVTIRQSKARKQYLVQKGETLPYAWDFPSMTHKTLVLTVNQQERTIEVSKLGKLVPMKFPKAGSNKVGIIALDLVADGPTIVLKLSEFNQASSKFRENNLKVEDATGFTLMEDPAKVVQVVQVRLEGIGISIISKSMEEIAYLTLKGFVALYTESDRDRQVSTSLQWIQIDNQMYGCVEPILLYPTVVSGEDKDDEQPILLLTYSQLKDTSHGVDYYQWFMVLLQELSLDIDEDFLYGTLFL
jgi:vacuolar protein sorting-associated protein 13A/C